MNPNPTADATEDAPRKAKRTALNDLDREILRFILRFGMIRSHHAYQWSGASPYTIREHLKKLSGRGFIADTVVQVDLRDPATQKIKSTQAHVWICTGKGADRVPEWRPVGYGPDISLHLPATSNSRLLAHHMLGVVDLACWYRRYGYQVVAEREIRSLELLMPAGPKGMKNADRKRHATVAPVWSVTIPGRPGIHPPDLGVVGPDGSRWAVELERATKTVQDYTAIMGAYRAAGIGQVWHVLAGVTGKRLMEAATRNGIVWGPPPLTGVVASDDARVRLQGWMPATTMGGVRHGDWIRGTRRRVGGRITIIEERPAQMSPHPPAGLPGGLVPSSVLQQEWALGREIDTAGTLFAERAVA